VGAVIEERDGAVLLRVRVQPRASKNGVRVEPDGRVRIALTAPPVEGAANEALTAFVAKTLGLPKRAVVLAGGEKGREKVLRLSGTSAVEIREKLGLD